MGLLRRYHPGAILLVAVAVGAGMSVPNTFLRTYADELHIANIGPFFAVYAVTALVVRILTRRLFQRIGNRPWVLGGLAAMAASFLLYMTVQQP